MAIVPNICVGTTTSTTRECTTATLIATTVTSTRLSASTSIIREITTLLGEVISILSIARDSVQIDFLLFGLRTRAWKLRIGNRIALTFDVSFNKTWSSFWKSRKNDAIIDWILSIL